TAPPPPLLYTLSLHDALPISARVRRENEIVVARMHQHFVGASNRQVRHEPVPGGAVVEGDEESKLSRRVEQVAIDGIQPDGIHRSEEHTSELQSRFDLVCRLL